MNSPVPLSQLQRLLTVMARLRDPEQGCAWDLAQTVDSLAPYVIEEAYEVVDAIARGDRDDWQEELGDLLLQVVFQAQLAAEQGDFAFDDVAGVIADKLIRRHPHIFPGGRLDAPRQDLTPEQVSVQWRQIKAEEKALARARRAAAGLPESPPAWLDQVGAGLPPFRQAEALLARAADVGYEWPSVRDVVRKLREEVDELAAAVDQAAGPAALLDELGDVLFCTVNLARRLSLDSEAALRAGMAKFRRRFGFIEQALMARGQSLAEASLEEMAALWAESKQRGL